MTKFTGEIVTPGFVGSGNRAIAGPAPVNSGIGELVGGLFETGVKLFQEHKNKTAISELVNDLNSLGLNNDPLLGEITTLRDQLNAGGANTSSTIDEQGNEVSSFVGFSPEARIARKARLASLTKARQSQIAVLRDARISRFVVDNPDLINYVQQVRMVTASAPGGENNIAAAEAQLKAAQDMGNAIADDTGINLFRDPEFFQSRQAVELADLTNEVALASIHLEKVQNSNNLTEQSEIEGIRSVLRPTMKTFQSKFSTLVQQGAPRSDFLKLISSMKTNLLDQSLNATTNGGKAEVKSTMELLDTFQSQMVDLMTSGTETKVLDGLTKHVESVVNNRLFGDPETQANKQYVEFVGPLLKNFPTLAAELGGKLGIEQTSVDIKNKSFKMVADASLGKPIDPFGTPPNTPTGRARAEAVVTLDEMGKVINTMAADPQFRDLTRQQLISLLESADDGRSVQYMKDNPAIASSFLNVFANPALAEEATTLGMSRNVRRVISNQRDALSQRIRNDVEDTFSKGFLDKVGAAIFGDRSDTDGSSLLIMDFNEQGIPTARVKPGLDPDLDEMAREYAQNFNKSKVRTSLGTLARADAHLQGDTNYAEHGVKTMQGMGLWRGDLTGPVEAPSEPSKAPDLTSRGGLRDAAESLSAGSGGLVEGIMDAVQSGDMERAKQLKIELRDKHPTVYKTLSEAGA